MRKLIHIEEKDIKTILKKHNEIFYGGSYGDPTEYGYMTIHVYYITYHGNLYELDTNYTINNILSLYCDKNDDIKIKMVPNEWYKLGLI